MLKRSLRIKVMAAMFSAAFFMLGQSSVSAYTYSGVTSTVDSPTYDSTDLVVTGGSRVTCNDSIKVIQSYTKKEIGGWTGNISANYQDIYACGAGVNGNGSPYVPSDLENYYNFGGWYFPKEYSSVNADVDSPLSISPNSSQEDIDIFNTFLGQYYYIQQYNANGKLTKYPIMQVKIMDNKLIFFDPMLYPLKLSNYKESYYIDASIITGKYHNCDMWIENNIQYIDINQLINEDWCDDDDQEIWCEHEELTFSGGTYTPEKLESIVNDATITVSNNSTLIGKQNIQTSKAISVSGTSKLITASGTITGGTITSDGDIIAEANYSASSGKSTIAGAAVTSTGAMTASKDIKATTGSISSNVISATGGNVVANNLIKATGKVKGNALNVGVINASSASITGNQSISGIFTTTSQAKLNGGAALGSKKITGLSIGTLSTTSTDAVNGKQLYTAMQSSGKTYAAGSDISISSANAISVAKAGKVVAGDTGIMTGDAVYKETSKIDSIFKANNASITSNNSKLDNLTTSIESLRKSLGTINSSVSDAISGLPGSLANFANKDLTDLSDTGINTLKSYIKSEIKKQMPSNIKTASYAMEASALKDPSAIDNVIASKANDSDLTALEKKVDGKSGKDSVSLLEDKVNAKADLSYVNDGLDKKADQSVVQTIGSDVAKNTSAIAKNTDLIQSNTEAISGLKESKADVSDSNIDVSSWSEKLGTGSVAKDDTGLVTGNSAASALDKKANIAYVAIGLGAMESGLDQMSQQVTKDVSRVGAGASALMGLHPTGDKFEFATAYGHYKNSNNTALGVFYKPSANSTVSVAGTIGDGDAMLSAGVSIKLGLNKEVKKVITPNEFSTMKAAVDSQDEKLDQMEKTLQQLMAR